MKIDYFSLYFIPSPRGNMFTTVTIATTGMKTFLSTSVLLFMICINSRVGAVCTGQQLEVTFNEQPEVTFNETVSKCCDTCSPGNGAIVNCSKDNQTQCQECISGKTYSNERTYNHTCTNCATCGNNTRFVLHPCNATHNTICECPKGFYYDSEADQCKNCTLCRVGWGASQTCNTKRNTICYPCEFNVSFSNNQDNYSECTTCSPCSESEVMLKSCTVTENTICLSISVGRRFPNDNNTEEPTVYKDGDDDDGDIIPVYCSVLGLVVVGLLGYVIVKHWRRLRAKRRHKSQPTHEDVEYSKASGADSGVFVESDSPKNYAYCLTSRVRDLPQGKRNELEHILSTPQQDSWKALAKELGYNNRRISEFESRGRSDNNNYFKHTLHDWERRDLATVNKLIQCLRNIGRDDAAKLVYLDSTEGRTQIMAKHQQQSNVV